MSNYAIRTTDNLSHSAKGTTWSSHKYIAIKNGSMNGIYMPFNN